MSPPGDRPVARTPPGVPPDSDRVAADSLAGWSDALARRCGHRSRESDHAALTFTGGKVDRQARAIARWSPRLAAAVEHVVDTGEFPLILSGDCSILLGAMLALKRRGRFGLLFIDGHADFYQPDGNPNGEAASMTSRSRPATGHRCS